ncbi:MAG: DUF1800 domain-containing protein [Betaproteobacteria bacterium]|nr:DUF1800 domain-containing protein [Betaproteobacteria bacterium]
MNKAVSLALLLFLFAGPAQAGGIGADDARHLLNRTGFGARLEEIEACAKLSREEALERLLAGTRISPNTPAPEWVNDWRSPRGLRQASVEERMKYQAELFRRGLELKNWWVREMLATSSPLTERMTLFWHNHFTSSLQKVRSANLVYRQNLLLRRHALGNFGELLHAVSRDPAMLVYLDAAASRRGQPNENFAREVMELFTLGEGKYAEADVKEAARAFTGWSVNPDSGVFMWRPFAHDTGVKGVLGRSGNLRGEDVLDILLAQPATAEFVTTKLWREFVSPAPSSEAERRDAARIAQRLRESGYDIKSALREVFLSDAFWSPENRGSLVKSPVELVVGTLRQLEVEVSDPLPFTLLLRRLGQDLFSPPNVKGWPGGEAWINATTLLARKQFLERITRADEGVREMRTMQPAPEGTPRPAVEARERALKVMQHVRFQPQNWLRQFGEQESAAQLVLLPGEPAGKGAGNSRGLDLVRALVSDPMYQLK